MQLKHNLYCFERLVIIILGINKILIWIFRSFYAFMLAMLLMFLGSISRNILAGETRPREDDLSAYICNYSNLIYYSTKSSVLNHKKKEKKKKKKKKKKKS